jgi:hypothetical protein
VGSMEGRPQEGGLGLFGEQRKADVDARGEAGVGCGHGRWRPRKNLPDYGAQRANGLRDRLTEEVGDFLKSLGGRSGDPCCWGLGLWCPCGS